MQTQPGRCPAKQPGSAEKRRCCEQTTPAAVRSGLGYCLLLQRRGSTAPPTSCPAELEPQHQVPLSTVMPQLCRPPALSCRHWCPPATSTGRLLSTPVEPSWPALQGWESPSTADLPPPAVQATACNPTLSTEPSLAFHVAAPAPRLECSILQAARMERPGSQLNEFSVSVVNLQARWTGGGQQEGSAGGCSPDANPQC